MQSAAVPPKFPIPWANNAGAGFVTSIPTASQIGVTPGRASLTDGFPPLNFNPVASGGIPPSGADHNGILKQITQWLQWTQAGGPVRYDSSFASTVGGYPRGALIQSDLGHAIYESVAENNTTNPNTGGANWVTIANVWSQNRWIAAGSANAQTIALSPAPTSLTQLTGVLLNVASQGNSTGPATLNVNGLGARSIVSAGLGANIGSAALSSGSFMLLCFDGANFQLVTLPANEPHGLQDLTTSGTFVVPMGVKIIKLRLWGAGGGGGGSSGGAASGGAGGGYSEGYVQVAAGAGMVYTIGQGGLRGNGAPTNGQAGTSTTFAGIFVATGGQGGFSATPGNAGAVNGGGGSGNGGQFNVSGNPSNGGIVFGGGLPCLGSAGGSTFSTSLIGGVSNGPGNQAVIPGGGGGGAGSPNGTGNFEGANGANGRIIVEW